MHLHVMPIVQLSMLIGVSADDVAHGLSGATRHPCHSCLTRVFRARRLDAAPHVVWSHQRTCEPRTGRGASCVRGCEKSPQTAPALGALEETLRVEWGLYGQCRGRESDGLALSSRNVRLDPAARKAATVISRALFAASHEQDLESAQSVMLHVLNEETTFSCDYAEIIDEADFTPATHSTLHARAIIAGWINGIRLIDNISMKEGAHS